MSDITRQKTIDYLYYLKTHYPKNLIIPEYIDYAISSLETDEAYDLEYELTKNDLGVDVHDNNVGNIDCISRADAIGIIAVECSAEKLDIDYAKFLMLRRAIKALPTVTPQEPRWIPVSEKKPNKGGEYLLWGKIDESEEEDYCFIGDYHEFDEVFGTEISNYDPKTLGFIDTEIEEYYSVVAWMPLPKAYKEVEE